MNHGDISLTALSSAIINQGEQHSPNRHLAHDATGFLHMTSTNNVVMHESPVVVGHIPEVSFFQQQQQHLTEQQSDSKSAIGNLSDDSPNLHVETNTSSDIGRKKKKIKNFETHCNINETEISDSEAKAPGLSYIALISMAIQSSKNRRMLLSEIYQWIAEKYPYYQMKDKSWRNSIRHNLSLNECFIKCGRSENGKGNYWGIHPANIGDFSNGDFRRRRARRQVRKCDEDLHRLCSNSPDLSDTPTLSPVTSVSSDLTDKYVPMASSIVPGNFLSTLGFEPMKSLDHWMPNHYTPIDLGAKFHPQSVYSGQSDVTRSDFTCPSTYPLYGFHYNPCRSSLSTGSPSDSHVNVNVNVNVCSSDPSQYQSHTLENNQSHHSDTI